METEYRMKIEHYEKTATRSLKNLKEAEQEIKDLSLNKGTNSQARVRSESANRELKANIDALTVELEQTKSKLETSSRKLKELTTEAKSKPKVITRNMLVQTGMGLREAQKLIDQKAQETIGPRENETKPITKERATHAAELQEENEKDKQIDELRIQLTAFIGKYEKDQTEWKKTGQDWIPDDFDDKAWEKGR
jgi:hypothetical protein